MRAVVVLLSLLSFTSSQEAAFLKKYNTLVSSYMGANTPKLLNLIFDGAVALKTSDEIMADLFKQAFGFIPQPKIMPALTVMGTYGKCINATGFTNPNATTEATLFAYNKFIQPLTKKVMTKITTMKKNKKADKAVKTEAYKIATAGLTKKLMQNFLDAVKSKLVQPVWGCGAPVLKEFMETKNYDMTWKKSG